LSTLDVVTDDHRTDMEQLRAEIDRAKASDADTTDLEALVARLERHLDEDDEHTEHGIRDRLEEAVKTYEVEHPEVTSIFARIVDTLSAAGL
jgi:uncharacterized tellurite resistance protein B-like protein